MIDDVNLIINDLKSSNEKSIKFLETELRKVRTGKASPDMLHSVLVDYYGSKTPLERVASVGSLDARTLTIQPWEKNMLGECAKGIINANLGLNPQNNGEMLIINIPVLTEERRKELVKIAKSEGENAKVSVRNNRKDAMDFVKELKNEGLSEDEMKVAEAEIQDVTDLFIKKIDALIEAKEKDIMTV